MMPDPGDHISLADHEVCREMLVPVISQNKTFYLFFSSMGTGTILYPGLGL